MPMKEIKNAEGVVIEKRPMTKAEILTEAVTHREMEVQDYQINIENFSVMIARLQSMSSRTEEEDTFLAELQKRLQAEKREQFKAQLVLDAARANLGA